MHRYLLGDLPEAEAEALEQQVFTEDETFEQLWQIENGLVDGYVRGRLSPVDREKFERHYLISPVHRQRVRVSQELLKKADSSLAEAEVDEPEISWRTKLLGKSDSSGSWWRFAAAATILLLIACSLWLSLDRLRLRREVERLAVESEGRRGREQELAEQISAAHNQNEEMRAELDRLHGEQNGGAQTAPRPIRGLLSFILSPRLIRGGNDPQSLAIPRTKGVVRLLMRVEQGDSRIFQAAVREVGGRQIWMRSTLKPRPESTDYAVTAEIPTEILITGDYILKLSVLDSAGEPEEVNSYFFRIIKQ
jgi:hypothetical protein